MASIDCSASCVSLNQLLNCSIPFRDIHERRTILHNTLNLARCSPPGYTYCSLCRQLANLSFEVGDKEDGIYNLVESHAVTVRHRALVKYHRSMRKSPLSTSVINRKYVQFCGDINNGYKSVLDRLQEMPKEWTVIQLSCVADAAWRFSGPNFNKWTPHLHIIRMECGLQPDFEPLHLKISPPPESNGFFILKEIQEMIYKNSTDHLKGNRHQFWKARSELDNMLWNIINYINKKWFQSASSFLSGRLYNDTIRKKIKAQVDKIAATVIGENKSTLSNESFCLLQKTAENLDILDESDLISLLARAVNKSKGSLVVKKLWKEFDSLKKDFASVLSSTKRGPVLLIIDEKLECLPFEQLDVLKDHPVTRVPSLHVLHGLFIVHKNSIENGLKVVDSNSGFYIINPDEDLNDMEDRMSNFLVPRVPKWKGFLGQRLSGEKWCEVVSKNDIFVYMGHGNGGQYWNVEQICSGIRSLSILFGCRSAGYKIMSGAVEVDATLQSYQAAACPSIVGMLWAVTDKDTDSLAQGMLDACLPKYLEKSETSTENGNKRKVKRKVVSVTPDTPASCFMPPIEPEIARAVIIGRKAARMLVTKVGVVVRGLPVCIK